MFYHKSIKGLCPVFYQMRLKGLYTMFYQKSVENPCPMFYQMSIEGLHPMFYQQRPVFLQKSHMFYQKSVKGLHSIQRSIVTRPAS